MKKIGFLSLRTYAFILLTVLLASCNREVPKVKTNFKVNLKTWSRVAPTAPLPLVINGTTYVSLAHVIVSGEGTATLMGKVKNYSNALTYSVKRKGTPVGAFGEPVKEVPSYPVTGGRLPLIQAGDFSALPGILSAFSVPAKVENLAVNLILFTTKGESLYLHTVTGTGVAVPMAKSVMGYTNQVLIVGGTGKFKNAIGQLVNRGFMSITDNPTGEDTYDGWISY